MQVVAMLLYLRWLTRVSSGGVVVMLKVEVEVEVGWSEVVVADLSGGRSV